MVNVPGPAGDPRQRPREVTIAMVLWMCTGGLMLLTLLAGLLGVFDTWSYGVPFTVVYTVYYLLIGGAAIGLAAWLGSGAGRARELLIGVGAFAMFLCLPIPLVVAALVLQYQPAARAWFEVMKHARR